MYTVAPEHLGRLIGIAHRPARRAPMQCVENIYVTAGAGLEGDHKGTKFPRRGVTILAREDWETAIAGLPPADNPASLPWTERRANLLVEGITLPRIKGAVIRIGAMLLEITAQTYPCRRMEEVHAGLLIALAAEWRGGITCRVLQGGHVALGDEVQIAIIPHTSPTGRLPA